MSNGQGCDGHNESLLQTWVGPTFFLGLTFRRIRASERIIHCIYLHFNLYIYIYILWSYNQSTHTILTDYNSV